MNAKPAMPSYVAYYRVSTARQAKSGLGLEAQQQAVESYVNAAAGRVLAVYQETESGKRADRPELLKAIGHAKRAKATLIVAKLDRLSRNVAFLSALMESGVEFVCCDYPAANRLTIHILIAVAENERELISQRTKDALAAKKRRGVLLGSARPGHWDGREDRRAIGQKKATKKAIEVRQRNAVEAMADLLPLMIELREQGLSLAAIAQRLNEQGHVTRRGKQWTATQVMRTLERAES